MFSGLFSASYNYCYAMSKNVRALCVWLNMSESIKYALLIFPQTQFFTKKLFAKVFKILDNVLSYVIVMQI